MVGIYIGNTDNDWFDFLASVPSVQEINFWKPSPTSFGAVVSGELFAFRLKSPRNKVGGFGVFTNSSVLPIQLAWEAFGQMNGVPDLQSMVSSIAKYRPNENITPSSFIGCRVLVQPVFFPPKMWFELPNSWSSNIVGGKRYTTDTDEGRALWERLQDRTSLLAASSPETLGFEESGPRFGEPTTITPRLGQGAFRVAITEVYRRRCALTGGKVLPALDAAHIRPYADGGSHSVSNGILLRKDIHSVFDAGYATIDTDFRFVVSNKIRDVFNNGEEYRQLHGKLIELPQELNLRPSIDALRWHNNTRFLE